MPHEKRWLFNTVIVPDSVTGAESFLWYDADPRLKVGLAYLWNQEAFRALATYQLVMETADRPALVASAGVQGIGIGNPGYSMTLQKSWDAQGGNRWTAYGGVGFRSNEDHLHLLGAIRYDLAGPWSFAVQSDGHQSYPIATWSDGSLVLGGYLIDWEKPALLIGHRF